MVISFILLNKFFANKTKMAYFSANQITAGILQTQDIQANTGTIGSIKIDNNANSIKLIEVGTVDGSPRELTAAFLNSCTTLIGVGGEDTRQLAIPENAIEDWNEFLGIPVGFYRDWLCIFSGGATGWDLINAGLPAGISMTTPDGNQTTQKTLRIARTGELTYWVFF
jgi:hypothetical protein